MLGDLHALDVKPHSTFRYVSDQAISRQPPACHLDFRVTADRLALRFTFFLHCTRRIFDGAASTTIVLVAPILPRPPLSTPKMNLSNLSAPGLPPADQTR